MPTLLIWLFKIFVADLARALAEELARRWVTMKAAVGRKRGK